MTDVLAPENEPFTKTKFAIRIDTLEAEIRRLREVNSFQQKQLKEVGELHKTLSKQFTKVAVVTPHEVEVFRKALMTYLVMPTDDKKPVEDLFQSPTGRKALLQALREYGVKLVEFKGDIKQDKA